MSTKKTLSVSELNGIARSILESELADIWIEGEIGNVARPSSGHIYFTLKDANAQIRCAMFRNRSRTLRFDPDSGLHIRVNGKVSLYEPRGDYQFIVERMEPAGEGALQQAFEKLKRKLFEAGLFDEARKRPLPAFPSRIGIITSPSGAAIQDVLQILKRRFPLLEIIVYPVQVQGDGASEQIVAAIEMANRRQEVELLVVTRGGGSIEDLWSFNDERVAYAIHASTLPVVSAVGHEVDFTIADFVADLRAPTPSAAAELISPDVITLQQQLDGLEYQLIRLLRHRLAELGQRSKMLEKRLRLLNPFVRLRTSAERIGTVERRLIRAMAMILERNSSLLASLVQRLVAQSPERTLQLSRYQLESLKQRLTQQVKDKLQQKRHQAGQLTNALDMLNPQQVLTRGYVLVREQKSGRLIRDAKSLQIRQKISLQFHDGQREAEVVD